MIEDQFITEDQSIVEEKRNKNTSYKVVIALLILIVVGLGIFILNNKKILFKTDTIQVAENTTYDITDTTQVATNTTQTELVSDETEEMQPLDSTKCLNNDAGYTYSNIGQIYVDDDLTIQINDDKKSATLLIDWEKFDTKVGSLTWKTKSKPTAIQIRGFSEEISSSLIGELGQDAMGLTLFFLTSDGTVEYLPLFVDTITSEGYTDYIMNCTYDYSSNMTMPDCVLESREALLSGITGVVQLYNASASVSSGMSGGGWRTILAARNDGSFYDLGHLISKSSAIYEELLVERDNLVNLINKTN